MQKNQSLEQIKKLLEAQKREFLSVMSHELRTPMTAVKGYLSMLIEGDAGPVREEAKDMVLQAYIANDKMIRLVENMLKTAKIEENRFIFNIGKVDLDEHSTLIINDFQIPAKEKSIELNYEKSGENLFVKGDPDRVREVLVNLVSNAIKFSKNNGKVTLSHRAEGDWIITDVEDNGIGISPEFKDKIFEIFSKVNLTLTGQEKGTGLGLYLSRRLAEAQGGKVWLERSELGKGSIFSFAMPKYIEKK